MNRLLITLSILGSLLVTACGPSKDDPLRNYKGLPAKEGPATFEPKVVYKEVEKPVEKKVEVEKEIVKYYEKQVPVEVPKYYRVDEEQVKASDDAYQVSRPKEIKFIEGQTTSFEFTVKIQTGKVNFDIEIPNLPEDAKIETLEKETNSAKYKFTWTASLGSIEKGQSRSYGLFTVTLKNLNFVADDEKVNSDTESIFSAISNSREIPFIIERTTAIPQITVNGLKTDSNSDIKNFSIDIKAPGTYEEYKPNLIVFDDPEILTDQADASPYVKLDKSRSNPEKISEFTWRYYYTFDQNKFRQVEMSNKAEALVRVSFQASTPWGTSSKKETVYFSVNLAQETSSEPAADFATVEDLVTETITPEIKNEEKEIKDGFSSAVSGEAQ